LLHPVCLYNILFRASMQTVMHLALDHKHLGAKAGMIAVLHTWGQNLSLHPHVHCIVPGGGMTKAGHWKMCRGKGKYLFPAKVMSQCSGVSSWRNSKCFAVMKTSPCPLR
jgi:hypothetical protein